MARRQSEFADAGAELVRQETVVLLVDLVELVRLMREHEDFTVRRWADFVGIVTTEILPRYRGVLVKSLGDGLMARFETVPDAVDAAAEMHRTLAAQNVGMPEDQHFHLRAGINAAMAWSDGIDIYGTGVNLAARLATLAGPGETIASASAHEQLAAALASLARPGETIGSATARDELTHGVDASCEDLGECILKHFDKPVRAYRVGPPSPHPSLTRRRDYGTAMQPTIAVIPFSARNDSAGAFRCRQPDCGQRDLAAVEGGGPEGDFTPVDRRVPRPRERCRRGVGASWRHLCPRAARTLRMPARSW